MDKLYRMFSSIRKYLYTNILILGAFLFFSREAIAQKEAYNWYFGRYAGLTFLTEPPTALTNGQLNTNEGCASISDKNGNLLLYTDGTTVYNKNHQIMDNGTALLGYTSSTQSSLIVKKPGSNSLYYIITVTEQGYPGGYAYSVADMSFNGGLGKITAKNILLLKDFSNPASTFTDCTEALTACYHANQTDVWIVVHQYNVKKYYSYLLTSTGLQAPVISDIGKFTQYIGQCRISPDGTRLAVAGYWAEGAEIYDFNSTTGTITNAVTLLNADRVYGLSFSANSKVLYISDEFANIVQFDLSYPTNAEVINSRLWIGKGSGDNYPQLQIGPDKRIYVAQSGKSYLGIIENPDVVGIGCSYVDNGISLNGGTSNLGLPTFMVNYLNKISFEVTLGVDTTLCPSEHITLDAGNEGATYLWSTKEQTQTITVAAGGIYYVDATMDNVTVRDTMLVSYQSFSPIGIPSTYSFCKDKDASVQLNPTFTEPLYVWQDGSTKRLYEASNAGIYWVERYVGRCTTRDTFTVTSNCNMFIPNLVTPNKDGLNDVFYIKNLPMPDWNLEIYNRWGDLIYKTTDGYLNNWSADNVSDGVYYYALNYRYGSEMHKGWLQVFSR